jgi:thiol-disulfide isomerase/thioredoxin
VIKKWTLQIIIFVTLFWCISYYKERNMLTTLVPEQNKQQAMASADKVGATAELSTFLPTLKGDPIEVKAQDKQTIIYFFAPWCQICHLSIGNLQSIYEKNPHIDIISVALDYESVEDIRDFTNQHQLTFPVVLGNSQVKKQFKISGYPSYYVLNKNNEIVGKSMGYSTELGLYLRSLRM